MEDFEKIYVDGVFVIVVNLCRSTINEASAFRKMVEEEINSGHTNLVIDLSRCDFIDSTFLGAIILALKLTKEKGYELKVVEPANIGEDIFTTRNFSRLFEFYKTRKDAIKSFEDDSQTKS